MNINCAVMVSMLGGLLSLPAIASSPPNLAATTASPLSAPTPTERTAQTPPAEQPISSPDELPQATLDRFFADWQVGQANFYQGIVQRVYDDQTVPDLEIEGIYRMALRLASELLQDEPYREFVDDERLSQFREADFGIWGLEPTCVAECTTAAFGLNLDEFRAIATRTTTTADDDFFALLQNYYPYVSVIDGEPWGWPAYFRRTWDYGGYSLLGEGLHLELLVQMDDYLQKHESYRLYSPFTVFAQQVQQMRHRLLQDVLVRSDCSGLTQEAILAELGQILTEVRLNPTETAAVEARIAEFQSPSADIQVNCQEFGQCTCEGG